MRFLLCFVLLLGLAAYLVAFYAAPMPIIPVRNEAGLPIDRLTVIVLVLREPVQWLFSNWFGDPPHFSLADRWPVALTAGLVMAWAAVLGWLLVVLLRWLGGEAVSPAPVKADRRLAPWSAGETASPPLGRLETGIFSLAVGLSAVSTWTLALGLAGLMDRRWMFVVPAIITLLAAAGVLFRRRQVAANDRRLAAAGLASNSRSAGGAAVQLPHQHQHREALPPGYSADALGAGWLWLALPFVLAIVLAAMLPPVDFDVCEYHLQAPKEFFQQGRITFVPHNVYANMPLGAEMLSLLSMVIAGDWWWGGLAGKTLIALFTPLCALAIFTAGRRFYSTGAGVVGALLYISIPWIVGVSSAGLIEGVSACYLFLAVYALLLCRWQPNGIPPRSASEGRQPISSPPPRVSLTSTGSTAYLILAGYLAGAAVATKYPAVLFVLLPLAAWTFFGRLWARSSVRHVPPTLHNVGSRKDDWKYAPISPANHEPRVHSRFAAAIVAVTIFLLAAAASSGLWFGKNWVQTGNPTYPLLYDVFDGKTRTADKDRQFNLAHRPREFSFELLGADLDRVLLGGELLSPLVVPLVVFSLVGGPVAAGRRWLAWGLLAYAIFVIAAWWLLTHRLDRFWIPILPVLALMAGAGACWTSARWWRIAIAMLLFVALSGNFLLSTMGYNNAWFVPLAQLRDDPHWISRWHSFFNATADQGAVLAVGDAAVFDLAPRVYYNTCFDDCLLEQWVKSREKKPDEIRAELTSRRIVYVFVNWSEIRRYRDTYGFTDFVQPEVFERLVEQGVLKRLSPQSNTAPEAYRVVPR
jgi:hypothetical protein